MSISILSQPTTNSIKAAYRPINIRVLLSTQMPIIFCDIYFSGIYYKTISSTTDKLNNQFDIQEAAQEYLAKYLAPNGGALILPANTLFTSCYCKIRGSSIDAGGFTVIETVIPIQATLETLPVAGTGLQTNTFNILNSTLQHQNNQDLAVHLATFKTGTWALDTYPLSHRKAGYKVKDSDYFPIAYLGALDPQCLRIDYTLKNGTTGNSTACGVFLSCPAIIGFNIFSTPGATTQVFNFTWDPPDASLTSVDIQYKLSAGSVWIPGNVNILTPSIVNGNPITLPLGIYDFRLVTYGSCSTSTSAIYPSNGTAPGACVPFSIPTYIPLPDAVANVPYLHLIPYLGSNPVNVIFNDFAQVIALPWMTVTATGGNIRFSGTPLFGDITNSTVTIDMSFNNACTSPNVTIADNINVVSPVQNPNSYLTSSGPILTQYTLVKNNVPIKVLINNIPGNLINFYSDNEISANFTLYLGGASYVPPSANLVSNGITYPGTISSPTIIWSNVNIINGMIITI